MADFIFVDADIIVFNKPAGMPCHPLKEGEENTALHVVVAKYPEVAHASTFIKEGGLIHRLDNNTSGVLLFARNPAAYTLFRELIKSQKIQKSYLALVQGCIQDSLKLDYPIAHHPKSKKKMVVVDGARHYFRGQPQTATTLIKPIAWGKECTLVQVEIRGGRRHQIRIHLAHTGHPLMGDELYGGPKSTYLPGHALHADTVTLPSGLKIAAPPPEAFKNEANKYGIGF